jgi:integrase/recombinase XerC/integrase/recombinase XerD
VAAIVAVQEQTTLSSRPASLSDLVQAFLADQDVSTSSRETYRRSLRPFVSWLELTGRDQRLSTLTREDILAYKERLQAEKSSYTVSAYLTVVRKLFGWLESQKLYPDITRGVKGAKKAKGHRKDCLTVAQIRQALDTMDRSTLEGRRDYALLNLLVRTGLRTVEVARAQVADVRQESGQAVLWIQGKGRDDKDDFVLLVEDTLQPLRDYLAARGPVSAEEPLFSSHSDRNRGQGLTTRSISRIVKQALQAVGLDSERLTAHSMRHTAITLAAAGGASLHQVQAMARHSDPKVTMVYFHNLERVKAGAERYISF